MRNLLIVAMLAVGCGGPSLDGEWSGTLHQTAQCSDGVKRSRELATNLRAIEDGDVVRFVGNDACGTISASLRDTVAVLDQKRCEALQGEGFIYFDTILGGTIALTDDDALDVSAVLSTFLTAPNGATVQCAGTMTGLLKRDK